MTIDELKAIFLNAYTHPVTYKPALVAPVAPGRRDMEPNHKIYSLSELDVLIRELKAMPVSDWDDETERLSARFVVEANGAICFAREGETSASVPNHVEMRSRCVAAGTIVFSDDHSTIIKITNSSGHFKPIKDCLVWPLAILFHLKPTLLAEHVNLGLIDNLTGIETLKLLTREEIGGLLPESSNAVSSRKRQTDAEESAVSNQRNRYGSPSPSSSSSAFFISLSRNSASSSSSSSVVNSGYLTP